MAPITSFIRISNRSVIPIRIFINRRALARAMVEENVLFEAPVPSNAANHKSLLRLKKASRIRLSNRDIKSLIDSLREDLIKILLDIPIDDLVARSISSNQEFTQQQRKKIILLIECDGWKCHLLINPQFIESLRSIINGEEATITNKFGSNVQLLVKTSTMYGVKEEDKNEPNILIEDEDEGLFVVEETGQSGVLAESEVAAEFENESKKEGMKNKYKSMSLYGKGFDLYVLSRPRI